MFGSMMAKRKRRQLDIVLPESVTSSETSVLLDGNDITGFLRGIEISSSLNRPTRVTLKPAIGMRAKLRVILPEAQITIADEPQRRLWTRR